MANPPRRDMTSLQSQVDAVKAAAASPSTCSSTTVVTLRKLLLPETNAKTTTRAPTKQNETTKIKTSKAAACGGLTESLSTRDRAALATHIINVTIKSLTEAAKLTAPPPPTTPSKKQQQQQQQEEVPPPPTTASKRTLQRSASTPMSPLQPRTLNRVATSPNVASLASKGASSDPTNHQSTKYLATAECARLALACLRSIKGAIKLDQTDFQVENGMSTLATKLVAIGLNELALKELRVLKRRLEDGGGAEESSDASTDAAATSRAPLTVCDLLDYRGLVSQNSLAVVASCQIQSLKLIATSKKPAHIEAIVPFLRDSNSYSPANILGKFAKTGGGGDANATKAARQLASLSQTLLSLAPSVSSSEDNVAMEPRLSPSPVVAFELQALAFKTQLTWWKLAGHQGKIDNDIMSPFSRCVRCLIRRQPQTDDSTYTAISTAFDDLMAMVRAQKHEPDASLSSPLATIYHALGSAAHSSRRYDDAYRWYSTLKGFGGPEDVTSVRACSVSARLLAASLKRSNIGTSDEELLDEVAEGFNASLSGTASEVNELLDSLSIARRSVAGLLMNNWGDKSSISPTLKDLLKKFLLRYPRFLLRWLGTPPVKEASTKSILQFDQRRQAIMHSISQVLDGALTVAKNEIGSSSMEWQRVDDVLQDCTLLLNNLHDPATSSVKMEQLGSYHVKMSALYFTAFSQLRKRPDQSKANKKQALQALTRSIDAVKERSAADKEKAQLPIKLELFADLCKGSGRPEDASRTLRSICTNMVEDGVLARVATALATQPPRVAWGVDDKVATLSRTLRSIAKLDGSFNDWTFFLPEVERAAVLEHLLQISVGDTSTDNKPLKLHDASMTALLRIYTPDRYPVRRLRVLLKLLSQQLGSKDGVGEITNLVDQSLRYLQKKDLVEDSSLAQFVPHLQTYHSSVRALADMDSPFPTPAIQDAVSTWATMVDRCQSEGDVLVRIDEPDSLLDHLLACDRLAGLKGEARLQVSILELALKLARAYTGPSSDDLITYHCRLASQYMDVGMFTEASKSLGEVKEMIRLSEGAAAPATMADFYLAQAEYLAGIEDTREAMECLTKASSVSSAAASARSKAQTTLSLSHTSMVQSRILMRTGDLQGALRSARSSVKWLSQDWSRFDGPSMQVNTAAPETAGNAGAAGLRSNVLASSQPRSGPEIAFGPRLWSLARPLFDSLMHISSLYAHIGMFQETLFYCETAAKIAESTGSSLLKAEASAWAASIYVRADMIDQAAEKANLVELNMPKEPCAARVKLAIRLGEIYRELEDEAKSAEFFALAEETTRLLGRGQAQAAEAAGGKRKKTAAKRTTATRTTRTTRAAAATTTTRSTTRRAPAAKPKVAAVLTELASVPNDVYQASLMASVLLARAMSGIQQRDWTSVASALKAVQTLPKLFENVRQEQLITAFHYLGTSVDQMVNDPVFSVMHDSTISFPAVLPSSSTDRAGRGAPSTNDGRSPSAPPAPRRGRPGAAAAAGTAKEVPAFAEALNHAQAILLDAQASALANGDNAVMHRISNLLQNTVISLTAASSSPKIKTAIQTESTTVAVEVARNMTWKREQLVIQSCKSGNGSGSDAAVQQQAAGAATSALTEKMAGLGLTSDMARFQDEFVELVPENWSVVSISLSDDQHDLCITKFEAGQSPFILRLPLERANSRDADSDVFSFPNGREELLDIVKNANRTSHSGGSLTTKASRNAWWAEREALDERLRELLAAVETTWLGGFKGIFSQHRRRPDLLARFQKSFHQLLERTLPSRSGGGGAAGNKKRGRRPAAAVTLDPRILDLFIGLGDPGDADGDFDEALNDLLYFVVDILQFHGERNAYDEIDFDAMMVETYDALRGYHQAASVAGEAGRAEGAHTILVLDKALHAFPWESMPCMGGLAVSRVPSLAALRRLITESRPSSSGSGGGGGHRVPGGHYVSREAGTYMLNPSSDLKNTQSYFEPPFRSSLPDSWTRLVNRVPTEAEFERALSSSDVLLYFGHGGGAQYIRGKTIRRLDRCRPATFLMGCSSAALNPAGEFEPYGPVWNYMTAGCPAVVGTLWDVTDRDIDRFAGRAFEEWGLFERGTFREKSKGLAGQDDGNNDDNNNSSRSSSGGGGGGGGGGKMQLDAGETEDESAAMTPSLAEAVVRARAACRFRYLNAASVVMYGIPVYIDRQ
ncbi:separase [Geosmithia morbida]|uniref:separase n=1 Tax=Geosmithia morbida TaxID=1094350 RepID=A0A9P4YV64_9HYPO|nr:separase [Geosmithia morbida]KAF4123117.1 separase [Geosmithia morbida]